MRKKHTKILATISKLTTTVESFQEMHDAGVDAVRINSAHCTPQEAQNLIDIVRQVSDRVPILIDTKGPEVRMRDTVHEICLRADQHIGFAYGADDTLCDDKILYVNYPGFCDDVEIGQEILLDDGEVEIKVIQKQKDSIVGQVITGGLIKGRRSVNVPGAQLNTPAVTDRDKEFLEFAVKADVDFIAHSFVRNKEDVLAIKQILMGHNSQTKIIAKIENRQGVDNIEGILDEAYGIMIARGDLGVEVPSEEVPLIQKKLIEICRIRASPSIVATQMLETMIHSPHATRAEISDIANAVLDGADTLMLSGETAYGKYPLQAVRTMTRTIKRVEDNLPKSPPIEHKIKSNLVRAFLSKAAVIASSDLQARAIIVPTISGASPRIVSSYRVRPAIYAKCMDARTMRELRLSFGIFSDVISQQDSTDELIHQAISGYIDEGRLQEQDLVIVLGVSPGSADGANFLSIATAAELLQKSVSGVCAPCDADS